MTRALPARSFIATLIAFVSVAVAAEQTSVVYKKGYVEGPFGQIHYHSAKPGHSSMSRTPVVFFHQNPRSAEEFRPLLQVVGRSRLAIAFDTPGYGESERPAEPPNMTEIAAAMAAGIQALGLGEAGEGPVDVFGFHTGTLIAAELAISRPTLVRRVVLSGIPYFSEERRLEQLARVPRDLRLTEDGARVLGRWAPIVQRRAKGVSLERAARIFVEDIHSLDKYWYGYEAVWSYKPAEQLPRISQPILVLQPHESLTEETLQARTDLVPHADLIELPNIVDDVFDTGPEEIGAALARWLDSPK